MKVGIIAFTTSGCRTALEISKVFEGDEAELFAKSTSDELGLTHVGESMRSWTGTAFGKYDAIVFVGAIGIAVREIAPFVKSKDTDPAVISVDEKGKFSVPVLSGHIGGANSLAVRIAGGIGALPVVTTATDINGKIAIDSFAVNNNLTITSLHMAKEVAARILANDPVGLVCDVECLDSPPPELSGPADSPTGVYIGTKDITPFPSTLRLVPRDLVLGIGCRRDTPSRTSRRWSPKPWPRLGPAWTVSVRRPASTSRRMRKGCLVSPTPTASPSRSTPPANSTPSRVNSRSPISCSPSLPWTACASVRPSGVPPTAPSYSGSSQAMA